MKPNERNRILITFHASSDAHDYVDYSRKPGWLDDLPVEGLEDFCNTLESVWRDIQDEMHRRVEKEHFAQKYQEFLGITDKDREAVQRVAPDASPFESERSAK